MDSTTGTVLLLVLSTCTVGLQQPRGSMYKRPIGIAVQPTGITPTVAGGIRAVYYCEQTVAIVNLSANNELYDCNLMEAYEPNKANELLRNLSTEVRPQRVSFQDMMRLIQQCELLDRLQEDAATALPNRSISRRGTRQGINPLSLLSGILPGTKWCGTGDIAENYHDLGQETNIDRCCRSHDLCPIKVRAQQTRYNLTNYSIYSKSHCSCDEELYDCLKATYNPTGNLIGRIYFNIIQVPCIEDIPKSQQFPSGYTKRFVTVKQSY